MKRHAALILMLGSLSVAGCKKKDGDVPAPSPAPKEGTPAPATKEAPPPTPTGSAAATPPAAGGCVDGAYKDPGGVYCVLLPEGVKPPKSPRKPGTKSADIFDSDDTFMITVYDDPAAKFENFKKDYGASDKSSSVVSASGDYDGGNGFYAVGHNDSQKEVNSASVVKSGTKLITCQAVANADKPFKPADVCKTLHAL